MGGRESLTSITIKLSSPIKKAYFLMGGVWWGIFCNLHHNLQSVLMYLCKLNATVTLNT